MAIQPYTGLQNLNNSHLVEVGSEDLSEPIVWYG